MLICNYTDPDLIIMTETKIDEQVKASEFLPKGYTGEIRKDRCKGGGGVLIATKQEYDIQRIKLEANISAETVWATISLKGWWWGVIIDLQTAGQIRLTTLRVYFLL